VSETDEPNPEPLLVETSNPVGAVTVRLPVRVDPETEKLLASETVFKGAKSADGSPVAITDGTADPKSVIVRSSIFIRRLVEVFPPETCTILNLTLPATLTFAEKF
jgi:hypothetical protein